MLWFFSGPFLIFGGGFFEITFLKNFYLHLKKYDIMQTLFCEIYFSMRKFFSRTIGAEEFRVPVFVFLFLILSSFGFFSMASEDFSGKNIFQDADQDGLTDEEEVLYGTDAQKLDTDGDGYSDGAEVRSGFDPMKPAPGDRILSAERTQENVASDSMREDVSTGSSDASATLSQSKVSSGSLGGVDDEEAGNLTEQVSEQIADILKKTSEDDSDTSTSLNSIQENLQKLLDERGMDEISFPEIDEKDIKIQEQDYGDLSDEDRSAKIKQDTLEYITKIAYIMASNAPEAITQPEDMNQMATAMMTDAVLSIETGNSKYLEDVVSKGEQVLLELREVKVPENMLDSHKKAIQLFLYASTLPKELKPSDLDPLASAVTLSKIQGLIGIISGFVKEVNDSLKDVGIEDIPVEL